MSETSADRLRRTTRARRAVVEQSQKYAEDSDSSNGSDRYANEPAEETQSETQASDAGDSSSSEEEEIVYCQCCQQKTELEKIPINEFYQEDAFYHNDALELSNVKTSTVLDQEDGHSNLQHAVNMGIKEMVSLLPTTAAIPKEYAVLCKICGKRFKQSRLICDECFYVPQPDERYMRECCNCFSHGVITKS